RFRRPFPGFRRYRARSAWQRPDRSRRSARPSGLRRKVSGGRACRQVGQRTRRAIILDQVVVSPTLRRTKRVTETEAASALLAAASRSLTFIFGSKIDSWSGRTTCEKKAPSLPSTIFSITFAGLPEFSIWAR